MKQLIRVHILQPNESYSPLHLNVDKIYAITEDVSGKGLILMDKEFKQGYITKELVVELLALIEGSD